MWPWVIQIFSRVRPWSSMRLHQARDLAARIDHRGLLGLGAPDDRAVLLQRRDRRDDGADRHVGHARAGLQTKTGGDPKTSARPN
jgi:hypothetical protein